MPDPSFGRVITGPAHRDAVHVAAIPVIANEELSGGCMVGIVPDTTNFVSSCCQPYVGVIDPFLGFETPDDYRTHYVVEGQRCWLFLFPGTITGLRHQWTHPAFPDEVSKAPEPPRDPWHPSGPVVKLLHEILMKKKPELLPTLREALIAADCPDQALVNACYGGRSFAAATRIVGKLWGGPQLEAVEYLEHAARKLNKGYEALIDGLTEFVDTGDRVHLNFDTPDFVYADRDVLWGHYETATGTKVGKGKRENVAFSCSC